MGEQGTAALIAFVLDRSGSMTSLVPATIEGFNSFVDEQRSIPGGRMSLTLFSTRPEHGIVVPHLDARYVAEPLENIPPLGHSGPNAYRTGGMTPLFDAVGVTIKGIEKWMERNPDFSGRVMVTILTDGLENYSREWHINHPPLEGDDRDLLGLIQWKQSEGWEFVFLGAGGSGWLERTFGGVVDADQILGYAHAAGAQADTFAAVSRGVTRSRATGQSYRVK